MHTIKIAGREIPLRYTMRELADMEEQIGTMDGFRDLILKGKRRIRNIASAIRIMGNSGLAQEEKPADLTDDWILDHLRPQELRACQIAVLAAFTDGWAMETEQDKVHDETLEEIQRKKAPGN